jgi:hypothetical protein
MTNKNAKAKAPIKSITAKLVFCKDLSDEVYNEIIDVLKKTKFNKISFPLNTYRYLVDDSVDENDTRMLTVGYIKKFDAEKQEFTVAVYPKSYDAVSAFENPSVEVVWTEFKGKLGVITKLNIVPDEE